MPGQIDVAGATLYFKFTTRAFSTGIPTLLSSSPVISIYKDDSTTQSTTGVTLTANFDSVAGLNHVSIDTTADATFYANGHKYYLVITTGTVDSVSVVGEVVGEFELSAPVVTVGNTLAVDGSGRVDVGKILGTASQGTAGYVGLDWGHITAPTTTVGLTNTTISSAQVVGSVTGAVGSVTGAVGSVTGNVGGNVVGTVASVFGAVGSVTGNVGGNVTGTVASVVGNVGGNVTGTVASVVGNVGGNVTGTVGSVVGSVGSVTGNVGGNVTGTVGGLTAAGLALFFTTNTTKTYTDAVTGSVVKETASNVTATISGTVDASIVSVNGTTFAGANVPCILANAVTHGGATAILSLQQLSAVNPSGHAIIGHCTSGNGRGMDLLGNGNGEGLRAQGGSGGGHGTVFLGSGTGGNGLSLLSGTSAVGLNIYGDGPISGNSNAAGILVYGDDDCPAIRINSYSPSAGLVQLLGAGGDCVRMTPTNGHGVNIVANGSGKHGIVSTGGTGGDGMNLVGGTDGNGLHLAGAGTGSSLSATDDVEQTGVATTFFGRMRQFYNRFFPEGPSGEVVKNSGSHTIVTKDSTGAVITTQPYTDDGSGNETIGPPS